MDGILLWSKALAAKGDPLMVFDWVKAARRIKEEGAVAASAGLAGDWEYTGGAILSEGKPVKDETLYLASIWAKPELEIDGRREDCYLMESETEWRSGTIWPEAALTLLQE